MLTLKHLRTLRHVSILIIREFVGASLKSLNFKKSLSLKFLKVNRGDVAAYISLKC